MRDAAPAPCAPSPIAHPPMDIDNIRTRGALCQSIATAAWWLLRLQSLAHRVADRTQGRSPEQRIGRRGQQDVDRAIIGGRVEAAERNAADLHQVVDRPNAAQQGGEIRRRRCRLLRQELRRLARLVGGALPAVTRPGEEARNALDPVGIFQVLSARIDAVLQRRGSDLLVREDPVVEGGLALAASCSGSA